MPKHSRHISLRATNGGSASQCSQRTKVKRDQIEQAITEPITVVESPVFKRKNAEKLVFETPAPVPRFSVAWYSPAIDLQSPPKRTATNVLTREEEAILFRQYNYARLRVREMQDRINCKKNPSEQEYDDLLKWFEISIDRRDHIVECNLALVLAMAKRSWATGEYADLVAEGNVALIRCVDRFDCELGYKFSTYACRALTTAFNRFGRRQIKHRDNVPFEFDTDREPAHIPEEIYFGTPEHINAIRIAVRSEHIHLNPMEQDVLRFRFGLFAGHNPPQLTLEKVGRILGISKERVRQIQIRALGKIRELLEYQLPMDVELMVG